MEQDVSGKSVQAISKNIDISYYILHCSQKEKIIIRDYTESPNNLGTIILQSLNHDICQLNF